MSGINSLSLELLTRVFQDVLGDQFASTLVPSMLVNKEWRVRDDLYAQALLNAQYHFVCI
jgi:hypothetical protein